MQRKSQTSSTTISSFPEAFSPFLFLTFLNLFLLSPSRLFSRLIFALSLPLDTHWFQARSLNKLAPHHFGSLGKVADIFRITFPLLSSLDTPELSSLSLVTTITTPYLSPIIRQCHMHALCLVPRLFPSHSLPLSALLFIQVLSISPSHAHLATLTLHLPLSFSATARFHRVTRKLYFGETYWSTLSDWIRIHVNSFSIPLYICEKWNFWMS